MNPGAQPPPSTMRLQCANAASTSRSARATNRLARSVSPAAVLVAGGGLLLIPRFGAVGAAVVILVVRVIVGISVVVQAKRIVNAGQKPVAQ